MAKQLWILVTGARDLQDRAKAEALARSALVEAIDNYGRDMITIVHGNAEGIDSIFRDLAIELGVDHEPWKARLFISPLIRNKFMVNLVRKMQDVMDADTVCWAFARRWASGTGHCAREARRAGLNVLDYGVSTEDPKDPF